LKSEKSSEPTHEIFIQLYFTQCFQRPTVTGFNFHKTLQQFQLSLLRQIQRCKRASCWSPHPARRLFFRTDLGPSLPGAKSSEIVS